MLETSDGAIALGMSNCECDKCAASSRGGRRETYDTRGIRRRSSYQESDSSTTFDETAGQIPNS